MKLAFDIFTVFAVSAGSLLFLAGTVGLIRFPEPLTAAALTRWTILALASSFWACWPRRTECSAR